MEESHAIPGPRPDGLCGAVERAPRDGRESDPTKSGIFRDHSCWKRRDGALPCAQGHSHHCEYPHARND